MKFLLIVISLAGLAVAAPFELEENWKQWKAKHGKKYANEVEESIRKAVWFRTFKHIDKHNRADTHTYSLGLNKFSDMVGMLNLSVVT